MPVYLIQVRPAPDCRVPLGRFDYLPTRPPIILDWWKTSPPASPTSSDRVGKHFTTVASWQQAGKDLEWNGERYSWSKHVEFVKFLESPPSLWRFGILRFAVIDK